MIGMNSLGENVRKIRDSKGYSQEYIADKMQISQSTSCKIECGKQKVRVERLMKLSMLLEVNPESLLSRDDKIGLGNDQIPIAFEQIHGTSRIHKKLKEELISFLKNRK